ncbi:MAG: hypothetical protein UW07_C0021G0005 [Candidatus Nomurabacteria bacterium GW2011_GWF2_43_8]|uniref:Uncharacterized protein n=3 Tax=Candidatus Nomuraibacteriota TaxID=1752729 RepID=A0A0G1FMR4_9BACT|nr:MAG: hypothetical protein UV76_C0008G0028 [Candidatus Nomurabacteria bacterium GW2011_GWA2_43_15]KKT19779.1 MAG: hypothetical protein UW02_C0005G0014 [Candidatus Nomurabacteria bacterium GW2011_GWB1_43_7]KKT23721.1 MAG: hypothetical protein UW07_C0021G0005 [Candidatus Nomurabacteria bacterium GW2011_GWF2_43_8]
MPINHSKGFTLIEVIIYIALFSLLMGTALITAYQLIDGSRDLSAKNTTQEEGNFVLRKINWALTGVDPSLGTTPDTTDPSIDNLNVEKYDGNAISVTLDGTKIRMEEDGGDDFITTDNVSVDSLQFDYLAPLGTEPAGITATAVIDGVTFTITKYFRK